MGTEKETNPVRRFTIGPNGAAKTSSCPKQGKSSFWEGSQDVAGQVGKQIGKHPGVSLAIAVACGVLVGWLVKR